MDITKVLEELRRELEHLDAAILSLERLQEKATKRGRPPKLLSQLRRPTRSTTRRSGGDHRALGGGAQS
jgi:hypothetical protein